MGSRPLQHLASSGDTSRSFAHDDTVSIGIVRLHGMLRLDAQFENRSAITGLTIRDYHPQ